MFLIGLGALLVLGGVLYMVYGTRRYLAAIASRPGFLPAGSRHSGAATAQRAILGARNELAGHSPYGNRCNPVGVGGRFLAPRPPDACKQSASKSNR